LQLNLELQALSESLLVRLTCLQGRRARDTWFLGLFGWPSLVGDVEVVKGEGAEKELDRRLVLDLAVCRMYSGCASSSRINEGDDGGEENAGGGDADD